MRVFSRGSDSQVNAALLLLRLAIGTIFVAHGGQKLFVFGLDGVAGSFAGMGIPMAEILGPFVSFVEFLGGLALITGLLTRLAALGLVFNMAVAILQVHLRNGFFNPGGIEFPMLLLAGSLGLVLAGAGRWSLDALIAGRASSPVAGEPLEIRVVKAA